MRHANSSNKFSLIGVMFDLNGINIVVRYFKGKEELASYEKHGDNWEKFRNMEISKLEDSEGSGYTNIYMHLNSTVTISSCNEEIRVLTFCEKDKDVDYICGKIRSLMEHSLNSRT